MFDIARYHKLYWEVAESDVASQEFEQMVKEAHKSLGNYLKTDPLPCKDKDGIRVVRYAKTTEFSAIPLCPTNEYIMFRHRDSRSIISFCPNSGAIEYVHGDCFCNADDINDHINPMNN